MTAKTEKGIDVVLRIIAPVGSVLEVDLAQIKRVVSRMIGRWPNPSPQLGAAIVDWMTDKGGAA